MNNELDKKIDDFLSNLKFETEEDIAIKFQELLDILNEEKNVDLNLDEFSNMMKDFNLSSKSNELEKAYQLLDKASIEPDKKEAYKLAKKAYEISPECFEALLFQVQLEEDPIKCNLMLKEGLKREKERLKKENSYSKFKEEDSEQIYKLKGYILGMILYANLLIEEGKALKAIGIEKEIMSLDEDDLYNTRYLLMASYSYLEKEKELLQLFNNYKEENLFSLMPLLILYYKKEDDEKSLEYLDRINKANPYFIKYFKTNLKIEKNVEEGDYNKGKPSEVIMYFEIFKYLTDQVPSLKYYILNNTKSTKKDNKKILPKK